MKKWRPMSKDDVNVGAIIRPAAHAKEWGDMSNPDGYEVIQRPFGAYGWIDDAGAERLFEYVHDDDDWAELEVLDSGFDGNGIFFVNDEDTFEHLQKFLFENGCSWKGLHREECCAQYPTTVVYVIDHKMGQSSFDMWVTDGQNEYAHIPQFDFSFEEVVKYTCVAKQSEIEYVEVLGVTVPKAKLQDFLAQHSI